MCVLKRQMPRGDGSYEPTAEDFGIVAALEEARRMATGIGSTLHITVYPDRGSGTLLMAFSPDNKVNCALYYQEGVATDADN